MRGPKENRAVRLRASLAAPFGAGPLVTLEYSPGPSPPWVEWLHRDVRGHEAWAGCPRMGQRGLLLYTLSRTKSSAKARWYSLSFSPILTICAFFCLSGGDIVSDADDCTN